MNEKSFTIARNTSKDETLEKLLTPWDIKAHILERHPMVPKAVGIHIEGQGVEAIDSLGLYYFKIVFPDQFLGYIGDGAPLAIRCKLWVIADTPEPPKLPAKMTFNDRCESDVAFIADTVNDIIAYLKHKEEN